LRQHSSAWRQQSGNDRNHPRSLRVAHCESPPGQTIRRPRAVLERICVKISGFGHLTIGKRKLDKGNFYRKIKDAKVLEDTGMRREGRGRPTSLYRFRRNRGDEQFVFRWREARINEDDA